MRVLLVEDDPLIARIYRGKLEESGYHVTLAEDGLVALKLVSQSPPNLIVLDIMLPKMSGVDVLKFIRQKSELKSIPVIVFSNAYLNELWDELTGLGVQEILLKSSVNPLQLTRTIDRILKAPEVSPVPQRSVTPATDTTATRHADAPSIDLDDVRVDHGSFERLNPGTPSFTRHVRSDFFEQIPAISRGLDEACRLFMTAPNADGVARRLEDLRRRIGFLSHMTGMASCHRLAQISSALEALLFELQVRPASLTDSCRQTIASAVHLLGRGLSRAGDADEQCLSPTTVLVVDDDPVSIRALVVTLDRMSVAATTVGDPFQALDKLRRNTYDTVLFDINLPGMSGLSLCEQMRQLPAHQRTPVIFFTSYQEFAPKARAILRQGDDLIGKPVLPIELTVKIISQTLRRRLPPENLPFETGFFKRPPTDVPVKS